MSGTLQNRHGVYGRVRTIEYEDGRRLYVKRTNLKTYVVSTNRFMTLESMVSVAGEYHFRTLRDLKQALESETARQ